MEKWITVFIVISLVFLVVGCSNDQKVKSITIEEIYGNDQIDKNSQQEEIIDEDICPDKPSGFEEDLNCFNKALEKNNLRYCENIHSLGDVGCIREVIKKNAIDDPQKCDSLENKKDFCLKVIGSNNKDISICETINNSYSLESCMSDIYSALGDETKCKTLSSKYEIRKCLTGAAITNKDISFCEEMPETPSMKGSCVREYASKTKDESICDLYPPEKDWCLSKVASEKNDLDFCYTIPDDFYQRLCEQSISKTTKDIETCLKIKNTMTKDACINRVAVLINDLSYCDKIMNPSKRERCTNGLSGYLFGSFYS